MVITYLEDVNNATFEPKMVHLSKQKKTKIIKFDHEIKLANDHQCWVVCCVATLCESLNC